MLDRYPTCSKYRQRCRLPITLTPVCFGFLRPLCLAGWFSIRFGSSTQVEFITGCYSSMCHSEVRKCQITRYIIQVQWALAYWICWIHFIAFSTSVVDLAVATVSNFFERRLEKHFCLKEIRVRCRLWYCF